MVRVFLDCRRFSGSEFSSTWRFSPRFSCLTETQSIRQSEGIETPIQRPPVYRSGVSIPFVYNPMRGFEPLAVYHCRGFDPLCNQLDGVSIPFVSNPKTDRVLSGSHYFLVRIQCLCDQRGGSIPSLCIKAAGRRGFDPLAMYLSSAGFRSPLYPTPF